MGMIGLLQLEATDAVGYLLAVAGGFIAGILVPDVSWSIYVSILVSYHLFLVWLVVTHSGKTGLSMPLWATVLTHAGCMVLVVTPATMLGHSGVIHLIFRYGVVSIALFERSWLFSKEQTAQRPAEETTMHTEALGLRTTPEDDLAWSEYLKTRRPGMTKPGVTIRQEHQAWLRARQQERMKTEARRKPAQQTVSSDSAATAVANQ